MQRSTGILRTVVLPSAATQALTSGGHSTCTHYCRFTCTIENLRSTLHIMLRTSEAQTIAHPSPPAVLRLDYVINN